MNLPTPNIGVYETPVWDVAAFIISQFASRLHLAVLHGSTHILFSSQK